MSDFPRSVNVRNRTASSLLCVIATSLIFFWPSTAFAQSDQQPSLIADNLSIFLLSNPKIQKELKLTDAQIAETAGPAKKLSNEALTISFNPEYRDQPSKLKAAVQQIHVKEKAILSKLNEPQRQRLQELFYQSMGIRIFQVKKVQAALALTQEQKLGIRQITEALQSDFVAMAEKALKPGAGLPSKATREANREKSKQLANEADDKINGLLSEQQRTGLKKLKGKPFGLYSGR